MANLDSLIANLQAFPDNWQTRQALVEELVNVNRSDEAAKVLSGVTELPADIESQIFAAKAYGALDPNSGIEILNSVIAGDNSCAPAHIEKSRLLIAIGDPNTAKQHYQLATQLLPAIADPTLASLLGIAAPAPARTDRSNVYYPAPGEYPTITLEEARAIQPTPLVNPESIPEHPELTYQQEVQYADTYHTPDSEFLSQVNNVDIHSAHYEEPVSYDYVQPDETIFEPTISASEIYVGAAYNENGEPIASLHESIKKAAEEKQRHNKRVSLRNSIVSLAIALLSICLVCVGMIFIVSALPRPKAPQLVSTAAPINFQEDIVTETLQKKQLEQAPVAPAVDINITEVNATSNIAFNSFEVDSLDTNLLAFDSDFSASASFGGESATSFFGGSSAGSVTGYLYDLKTDNKGKDRKLFSANYETTFNNFSPDMKRLIRSGFGDADLKKFTRSKTPLTFNTLAIPSINAKVGPESFKATNIKPSSWIAVYRGKISPEKLRLELRFLGDFDDVLYVFLNGKLVLDGSVNKYGTFKGYSGWKPSSTLPTLNQKWGIQGLRVGPWVRLSQNDIITIVVGEIPGGAMRGTLLCQERGVTYNNGKYSPFVIGTLSGSDQKRMAEIPGITFENIPVIK